MSEGKNDWRSKVKAMMTDPNYAEKMASVVDDTRKVNTGLINKSEEYESSLSLDKPTSQPLDLARIGEMKAEDAARATMPSEESDYSGVSDLATKVYAEERSKRIGKALQHDNTYFGAPHGMRLSQAASDIYDVEKAKDVQGIYDKVLQDESVSQAIHANANKALLKAMEANKSLSEDEQKKVYDDAVSKQLEAIGKGIDKYLYDINAPKSEAEWVAKNAVNSSIMGQMLTSPMNVEGGENTYRQQALADYGAKASWLSQGISMAGSLIIDTLPMMGIGTAFAAPASKAAMWGVGKVGGKALQGSLIGRGIVGSVGGAATLGGYNAASALTTQFSNGQFDLGEITSSAGHGALMGGLTGVMSPVLRGFSQGMGKVGKAATMAGGLGAEAGIFSAAELAEMENPYDFETIAQTFGKNVVVIGGLKLSNPVKTIGEYKRWYNEGKQSNFNDADYKMMADFAKANGFANSESFSMGADGVYSRSIADRVTGNRTLLEMTKLEGGKERNLAIEMYNDPNVPISLKTKIAAKMNLPAPKPLLANGVRVEGNKAITYCTMPNGAQQVIEIKEFARPRNARAFANEFSRTTARKNDLMQTEAAVNNISTEPIVIARLNEQAKRNGTTYDEELARLNDIVQRAAEGTITAEDVAYYSSIVDTDISATEAIKQGIKDEYGVEIDDVLKSDGNLTDAQDKALTAYADALRGIAEQGNPTTERMLVASTAGVADYVALNRLGIEQTRQIMMNPTQRAEIDAQMRSKYGAWLKYFDGKMGEDALAAKLGYDLNNSTDLQSFLAEQAYFKNKAADRIAANTTDVAKQLLEQGSRGVRFTEGGKVKLQGVPYPIEVSQEIVDRYDAAMQGSGEPMSRIVNDALKDIIKQSETPVAPKEPIAKETPIAEEPMNENEVVTQQMVDARLAEIDTDLQGIEADGVQRMTINGRPVAIIKGRIVADADGKVDKTKSSTEVAYMLLDENGRPILEDGKPKIEVGVKPSNVRVEDIEQWRSVDDYKAAEEQRIRDNNRLADEAMQMADEEMRTEEMPAESKAEEITDPQTTDELLTLCKGDRELALDVAMDELNRAQQSKGKGATPAETMEINKRIRMYQQMLNELSKPEQPVEAPTEQTTDTQVTDDMEFIYQKDLGENHEGMEPMQLADGRYKWVGLQRGELTATMGERDAELLDGLAKKLGIAIIPIDVADSAVNGYYRDGNIYVNTNRGAEWTMRWVAGHEMLHDVAKKSPEAYDAYKQAVLDMWDTSYIDNQVKQIIDDYAASGKTIDREQALTELVNDFGGELFSSRDGLNILDNILKGESRKGNTGFVETIKQWWEKLKEWFGGTPYYNEAQKMLEQAYKDAMENVDYKAREEQLSRDMDDAFFGETDVVKPRAVEAELKETKDFTPTKMPSGTAIENKPSGDFSVKSIMRGVGIDAQTDGDNVWFEKDGKRYSKDVPMAIEESKSGILKDMVDQCVELGLMDEAKSKDVYKMYTGIVNKIIEKADGSFADLNNQYLWLGETVYKVVHSNSDKQYKRSLDVTLVCKKNEAVIRGISELQRRQGFGVTPAQIMQLYYSTLEKGYQVPCPVCYVFSRYIQNGQYTSNLMYGHSLYDNNPYFRNPAEMTPEQKAAAEAYWLKEYKRVLKDEEKNKKLIDACKSVMSWATKEMDKLMLEAATGSNKADKRKEYEKRAAKLDEYYRAAINLVSKADMSGYITSVITKPIVKDKKVVGMEMREDAGQKLTPEVEEAILDFRKAALAKTKYPHIARYIASKGSAAGKGYNFESDNPMGDVLQQLSTDAKNNYQEAMNATTDNERAKLLNEAKKKTMNSARYAARQTLRGGIRQWSWSDNIEALAPDVALNAMQVGMLGGAMQTYSKQLEGIEMMAAMNAYVNGSLMGYGMGYQKVSADFNEAPKWQDPKTGDWYSLHFDDVVGVQPYNRNGKLGLFALNEMYDRAGNILVGMNDIHIRTAMADPRIFFIIPWHASGMSDHILKQMNSMLKLDMAGFKASDYTKHQEEKMYENKLKKQKDENGVEIEVEELAEIPESTTQLWQSHDYSEKFLNRDGTQPKIELADGRLSADQLHYRELRDAVLMYSNAENAGEKDKAFWAEHQDWLAEIKNDIFLNQVLESVTNGPGKFGIAMTTEDCGFVYPYEYWDKASTYNGADVNGQRYVEYCRRLGVKPKFSGIDGKAGAYGNFVDDSGYWKLLIDRRMYDREGNYQDLTPVDISGFKADFIDQDKTAERFPVTVVADKEATSKIVDDVQYNELKVYNDNPLEVGYEQTIKEALKEAKKAEEKYIKAKQAIQITKTGKQKVVNQSELYKLELDRLAKKEALADIENDNFLADEGAEMSIVRDRNRVEELENEELVPMFRTFQILDGALYSPMATVQRGEKVHSVVEGDWWKSDENPDLAKVRVKGSSTEFYDKGDDRISKKDGQWVITIDGEDKPLSANGNALSYYFLLKKGEKGDVVDDELYAAYNPYIHASRSSLNDQFKGAYLRPNLVLVEVLVPKSEIDGTNRYKADYAKDGIGEVDWNSGSVIKQAVAAGHPGRKVALSRYAKIGKVFSNAEWAQKIDEELSAYKEQITLPFVAFPPEVLRELANMGYKVEPPTSKKAQPYYEAWLKVEEPTDPNGGGEPTEDAEFSIKRRFGGNSGYVGYSKSVRAVDAEERGLRSVSKMDANFKDRVNAILADNGVGNPVSLAEIKRIAKGMRGDEWHHTSMYGNRTEYYSAESIADKIMGKQSEITTDPRISANLERMSYRESLADKMKTDRDIEIEVDLGNGKMHTYTKDAFRSSDGLMFDIGKALREEPIEKQSQIQILNTGQVSNRELYLPEWYIDDHSNEIAKAVAEYNSALANAKQELDSADFSIKADKQKQLDIINRTNPAPDDYHTWVRTTDDIKTLQEAVDEVRAEDPEYNLSSYPDVTDDMINEALQSGKVTVYSSNPIKEGVFVSPSKMQAKDYAGGSRVYSKQVPINNVAWINTDEGMFAPTSYSVKGKRADESVLDYAKRVSEGAKFSIKGGKNLEDRLESKYTQTRLRAARELAGDDESALMILDDLEPQTLEEYVAEQLGANGRKLLWENGKFSKGLKAHLGVSENEKKTYRSIISKDGYPPEVLAEEIWKSMPEEFYERYTDQDVFNTILDLASSYTRKQLKDFVVNRRIDAVIEFARKQEEWDAAQEEMYLETLSEQERNAYLANKEEMERVDKMSKKERAEYYRQKQVEQMLGEMTPEERAEYEAKEQWRKENAAAIASSFFAERRLDKADKIQKLKEEINKLIKETRATNKENSEKVKEIAKEMQTYIKENIPTETQGDMTRPQFEQVIKQLSNAITRKDLEKPMRMVEYIGANANRRALTRQMRDFLKQGFKGMTPKGLVKAKNVDGATSRVLGLAKSLYESMGKQPLGSDLRALQTKVRGIKAELEDLNNANGGAFSEYVEQINAILKKSGVDRYEEMTKYYNELTDRQDVGEIQVSEVLDHINRMLPELFSIELVKEQRTQAKADSAMTTKEDLEQLKNDLEDKREKGILSEEDQAVLDNMAMYELMVNLQQRQLDIDGPGTSSIASQMAAKVREAKQYRDELEKYDDKKSGVAKNLKDNIKRVNAEMEELFVQRTQAQKEVNANVAELLDNLKQLRDTGNSALKEWSKNKQERETRIVTMANASFGKDARGYWSEVDRRGGWKRDFSNKMNNLRLAALMSPALSFEYMVGVMDPRYYTNESPIYKQFIKGEDGLIKANDNFFEGLESFNNGINEAVERFINRNAMQSLKEYFNRGDRFATEIIPFEFEVKENVNGEVVTSIVHRDAEMTRGRAAKIYAWSRMADGMAKLKAHGVTDETLEVVKAFIGQDYMDFIDWVEDEYFPKLRREKYNPIYKQMYGISMAENEHYFPFETYKKDIRSEKELEQINSDNLGGGIVGNIIERKRNNARLDFTDESPDIFDAISEYGRKMEEWAAYAQVREDLKKVINNKQFKQHCDMLGTNYYNHFLDAARVASRLYNPQPSAPQLQSAAAKLQKVFASAAISLRVSTALKQLLSAPTFAVYSLDPAFHKELLKTASVIDVESAIKGLRELANGNKAEAKRLLLEENWVGHYNWCVNNLPSFRERVSKGGAGNPILEEKGWSKFSDDVQSVGMLPNRLVDAFTCSVGAKAIYEYAFNKYKKTYDEATAHNMAVTDAEIAFNSSQQSSNPVFLSPLQSSKEFWLRGIMNYKNSPIGYYRNGMKANIDLYRATKALFGKPKFAINGEQVGFESNGVKPAAKAAEAAAKSIMFNFFLNYLWAFGTIGIAGVSYTMMNNDNEDGNMLYTDEEFDKATGGNMGLAVFNAATQGIPWVSGFASVSQTGQDYTPSILFSEMNNYLEQVNKEGFMSLATAQLLIDLGLKNAVGVDPEVWGQIYRGAQGIMADRPMRTEDFMNLLASPRSAIAGVAKQKVGEYNNMQDYVNARIESEREIGINETMDLGKKLTGLRPLRKSKLDGYIDEYLADKIPDYRELANKPDEKAKEERMEESNAFKNLNTLVSTVQHTEEKKKSSKKIDGNEETKDKVKKIRKAVNVIHKLYASGDASSAQRIADELERRLKRGYNENGASLDDKLKNVDIYDSTGTSEQRGTDGFDTMFDRAMLGGFDGVYLGSKLD